MVYAIIKKQIFKAEKEINFLPAQQMKFYGSIIINGIICAFNLSSKINVGVDYLIVYTINLFFAIRIPIVNAKNVIQHNGEDIKLPFYNKNYFIEKLLETLEKFSLELCNCSLQKKRSNNLNLKSEMLKYLMRNIQI